MCFSVNVNLVKDELESRYGATFPGHDRYQPSYYYHAFGLPELPVVCSGTAGIIQLMRWGLIPFWTRTIDDANEIRFKTLNARAESLFSKPSFSASVKSRRCLIPVKGFFEWQHLGDEKIPWYIYHRSDQVFSLAGIFDRWTESTTGEIFETFSVITTEANDLMAIIHNSKKRMPAIIEKENEAVWLDPGLSREVTESLLKPLPSDALRAHTISRLISNRTAEKNTPDIIKPYDYENRSSLF